MRAYVGLFTINKNDLDDVIVGSENDFSDICHCFPDYSVSIDTFSNFEVKAIFNLNHTNRCPYKVGLTSVHVKAYDAANHLQLERINVNTK